MHMYRIIEYSCIRILSVHLSIYSFIHFVYLFIYVCIYVCIYLFIYFFLYFVISLFLYLLEERIAENLIAQEEEKATRVVIIN